MTKKGKPFSISSITYIISNPFYIGKIQFAKYRHWSDKRRKGLNEEPIIADGKHAPIIDKALWDKVQFKRQESRKKPQVHGKGTNLLTGIVKCPSPKCGAAMAASNTTNTLKDGTKKRIRYYSCSNFRNKGSKVCSANSVRADVLEKYVMDQILEIIKSKKVLKQLVEKVNEKSQIDVSSLNHDIAYKQSQYEEIKAKMHTLTKTIEDSPDLDSVLKPTILSYQDELNQINNQIHQLEQDKQAEAPHYDADMIANILQTVLLQS